MSDNITNRYSGRLYHLASSKNNMFYSLELQMVGIILFTAMAAGGISLWLRRRNNQSKQLQETETEEQNN